MPRRRPPPPPPHNLPASGCSATVPGYPPHLPPPGFCGESAPAPLPSLDSSCLLLFRMPNHPPLDHVHHHLRNVRSVIRDALKVFRNEQDTCCAPDRRRILDHVAQQLAVDLIVEPVHFVVASDYFLRQRGIVAHESVEAVLDHRLCNLRHP